MKEFSTTLEQASEVLYKQPLLRTLSGSAIVSGDIHGDLDALQKVLQLSEEHSVDNIVLLGDYVDRGPQQVEVVEEIARQIITNSKFTALRGNHEDIEVCKRYGFTTILMRNNISKSIVRPFFANLPFAAVSSEAFMVHGGIPINPDFHINEINEYERSDVLPPGNETELLWNDPIFEKEEQHRNYRNSRRGGRMYEFGLPTTSNFLQAHQLKLLLRAHSYLPQGMRRTHKDMVLSLFTSQGGPYSKVTRKTAAINLDDISTCEIISLN